MSCDFAGAIVALSITILAVIWKFRQSAKNSRQAAASAPGPWGLPLLGYLPFLGTDLHREFAKLASRYGPIFQLYLGNKPCLVITSASLVKEVVREQDTVFANHELTASSALATFGGNDIVFSPYGNEWKKLRKVFVREMLGNTILDNLYALRRQAIQNSIKKIYREIGTPTDVLSLSFFTVSNAIMSMLCGGRESVGIDGAEFMMLATELMELFGKPNVSDIFPALAWLDLQGVERETKKVVGVFEALFDKAIEQRKRSTVMGGERKDFLEFLLEMHEHEDSAESISLSQLKALLMDIVVGGTDTTSTTVEWTMAELLHNPEAMNKVLEQLTQVVGLNGLVEESHLSQLTYLNAAIKETLRLHPPLPMLVPRYPSQSTTIGGYSVAKGTRIFLNVWAIQRDPNYWEAPLEFRPERFLSNDNEERLDISGNNFNFTPLGSGRRVCAGIPLVERMLNYVIASFLHSFDWKLPAGVDLELSDRFGIVVKKLLEKWFVKTM